MSKGMNLDNCILDDDTQIPKHALESLARRLYPAIREYFESEEGQREFSEWKKEQEKQMK